jgi:hypothetical protein
MEKELRHLYCILFIYLILLFISIYLLLFIYFFIFHLHWLKKEIMMGFGLFV